jgi:hypothetical protein
MTLGLSTPGAGLGLSRTLLDPGPAFSRLCDRWNLIARAVEGGLRCG